MILRRDLFVAVFALTIISIPQKMFADSDDGAGGDSGRQGRTWGRGSSSGTSDSSNLGSSSASSVSTGGSGRHWGRHHSSSGGTSGTSSSAGSGSAGTSAGNSGGSSGSSGASSGSSSSSGSASGSTSTSPAVTFSGDIQPFLQSNCVSCHSSFGTYSAISSRVNVSNPTSSSIYTYAYGGMGGLSNAQLSELLTWISEGAPNN